MQDNVDEEIEWASMFWPCNQRFIVKYWMSLKIADKRCWLVMIHWTRYTWQKKCMVVDIHRFAKRSIRRSTGRRKKTKTNKEAKERRKRKRNDYQFFEDSIFDSHNLNLKSWIKLSFFFFAAFIFHQFKWIGRSRRSKSRKGKLGAYIYSFIFHLHPMHSLLNSLAMVFVSLSLLCSRLQLLHLTTFHWLKFHKNAITQQDTMTKEVSKNSRVIR